jgi:hypothetical protein
MQLPDGISLIPMTAWENRHQNFNVRFTKDACFNMRLPFNFNEHEKNYHATTKNFQWLIQHAIDRGITLRALGAGWSFTEVAVCDGGIVDTREIRDLFRIQESFLSPSYLTNGRKAEDLIFTQCGMSMLQMSKELESENGWMRSLKASGASNGQTMAGATATGTHGAAFEVGAVHDTIVGLHMITGPDKHVWLERASYPVASQEFINWLGAERISDDDVFNAAVVSFGSFGFIHGMLFETEPIFLLEKRTVGNIPYNSALRTAINQLNFNEIASFLPYPLDSPDHHLYHFEVLVNPHKFAENDKDKGVFMKVMYKIPYFKDYPKPLNNPRYEYGDDLLGIIQTVLDHMGRFLRQKLIPLLVTSLLPEGYNTNEKSFGTIGKIFGNTKFRGKAASAAIAIDIKNAALLIDEIVKLNKKIAFPGAVALRYVKGTKALLGFTKFEKTCVLELDGVESKTCRNFLETFWNRLEELNIPYTLHWGKLNFNLDKKRLRRMYGDATVDQWISCRHRLLDENTRKVFTNSFMKKCGLDE